MKASLKAAAVVSAAALGAAGAAWGAAKLFTDEALDRTEPPFLVRAKARMVTGGVRDPLAEEAARAAERLRALPLERVEITAWDGTRLVGHWRTNPGAKRVVVAMHGWRSAWYWDFGASADFLYENGCAVLYAEQRGQGESGGEHMTFGIRERYDCLDWVNWVEQRCGSEKPVYLTGISMGAATVLLAAGVSPLPGNIHGVMADCGFTSMDAIWRHVVPTSFHLPYGAFQPLAGQICRAKIGCGPDACSTVEALRRTELPVLLIHGEADSFVPPSMTMENYAAAAGPKRLLLVPGARHGMSYLVEPERYQEAVLDFWRDFDKKM